MRVLITDGDTRQALAATRSLGLRGHEVIVAAHCRTSLSGESKYCGLALTVPAPMDEPYEFARTVARECELRGIDVLLPMTEVSTLLSTQYRYLLPKSCVLPFPTHHAVETASNKAEVLTLAQAIGVPIPTTHVIEKKIDATCLKHFQGYPVVIKPARSRVLSSLGGIANSVGYANDIAALRDALNRIHEECYPVLLQERVVGQGVGVFLLMEAGRRVAHFSHRRIREKPPSGGVSVLSESTAVDPLALVYSEGLLQRLSWHGPAMVEFKRDTRDGSLRLMEINGRFWGSLQLAIDAGVDFPSLLVDMAVGGLLPSQHEYRVGVRSRWLAGDLDALLMILLKDRQQLNLPDSYPNRVRTLAKFLDCRGADVRLELERLSDPRPAILEWRRRLVPARASCRPNARGLS